MPELLQYQAGQFSDLLADFQRAFASGAVYIHATLNPNQQQKAHVLVLKNGEIVYGGVKIPDNNQEFARTIGSKFNHGLAETAIRYTIQKLQNPFSFRELLERIVRIRVFTWEEIETAVYAQVVQVLEQVLPHPGSLEFDATVQFDLSHGEDGHGLDWSGLMQGVTNRASEWVALAPLVPSMNAVPQFSARGMQLVTDSKAQQHLQQLVDGTRSLLDIAHILNEDPLELARSYMAWAASGWISFEEAVFPTQPLVTLEQPIDKNRPIVLSVDDSLVVQTMIKRALNDRYHVLLTSNAIDALKVINTNPIALLLLDVTMPDIDGLEFCRTVRSIPKFKNLPVIMLTARDKFSDKLKGQIAGATYYLNKPIESEQLLEVISRCIDKQAIPFYS